MSHPMKSTNVRATRSAPPLLRLGFGALGAVAPPLAARLAERLFLTPPRHRAPERERAVLASGRRFDVPLAGKRLVAWSFGQGPPVLLVHGWGGRGGQLASFVEPLVVAGLSAVTFDAPGHGLSSGRQSSLPELALAVTRVAESVGPLHGLVGHSMGASAASVAIADGLPVGRAVLIAPPADAAEFYGRFARAIGISADVGRETRRRIEDRFLVSWSKLNAERLGPRLELPLLVIHDRGDPEVPWIDGAVIADACPNATLYTTDGLGHRRVLRDPDVLAAAVGFLRAGVPEAVRCARPGCPNVLTDRWDDGGDLCARCGIELELYDRSSRWGSRESRVESRESKSTPRINS